MIHQLATLSTSGVNAATAAQYDALAAGTTVGGNFREYQDAADLGFFTKDAAGYGNFLAWNSAGLKPDIAAAEPDYLAWKVASIYAAATVNKLHTGNSTSAIYTPELAQQAVIRSVQGLAYAAGLSLDQQQNLQDMAVAHLTRLLGKWGFGAAAAALPPAPAAVPRQSPVATAEPAPEPPPMIGFVQFLLSKAESPGDGIHFQVIAYRIRYRPKGSLVVDHSGPWIRFRTVVNRLSSTLTSSVFLEDVRSEVALDATGRVALADDWTGIQAAVNGPFGPPPPAEIPVDVYAAPNSTSLVPVTLPTGSKAPDNPPAIAPPTPSGSGITDVAVPPPPTVGPGVTSGAAPPASSGEADAPDVPASSAPASSAPASSSSSGRGLAVLVLAVAVLALLARKGNG